MKRHLIMTLSLAVVALAAQARQETLLSEGWQFTHDGARWETVTVPHDWAIAGPFDKRWDLQVVAIKENGEDVATEHSGRSGALPWIGRGTYRRTLAVPAGTERAELLFDGAMASPKVYVNGELAGGWEYGYNAFHIDITPYIHNDGSENELEVRLENLEESNRWYPGAGLYRPVTLVTTARDAFDLWGLCVRTPPKRGSNGDYIVEVSQELAGTPGEWPSCEMTFDILDSQGRVVAQGGSGMTGVGAFKAVATLHHPQLWSPETPCLYRVVTRLHRDGRVVDEQSTRFGVRTITFSREHGFQLNGVTRKFRGVCLHHDLGPLGAAVNKTALIRQIKMMKAMGADAIRTSHNMPSTWQMEVCDSLGMMVMAESFDSWSDPKVRNGYNRLWDEWWRRDIVNLIRNHRNHPCIVMWSVGNEIPEQWKPEGAERYKRLIELCHRLDPTRPVTCGMDQPDGDLASGFAQVADVPGYNYRVHRYEETFPRLPQGFLLGSETASTVSTRGHYVFPDTCAANKEWPDGQCSGYDTECCWWSNLPDDDWRLQDDKPWTIGEFVWTGYDYLGEPTPYDAYWPSRSSYFGIVDLAGLPKDRYWLYRSHWKHNEHTLHLLPHWTWPGREGQVTPVYCYTDYPSAELFVNGKSQGRISKDTTSRLDRYRLRWRNVRYEPGELKVVAYDAAGNRADEQVVRTAGRPHALRLEPEREVIAADGTDLAFVTVSLVDNNGTLCPDADDQLTFAVKGAGTFKAVCNGDATSTEAFTQPTMRLFHGQLVVLLQAAHRAGTLTLTVTDRKAHIHQSVTIAVK
ncbi:MAG: DUF4982 domain-containing protein [Muribaculaceae bacterium]|nr:DUF4982 domain-containing protein [Muribaculaceae bacterium]